jgi:hypothetical protein
MKIDMHVHSADIGALLAGANGPGRALLRKRLLRMVRGELDEHAFSEAPDELNAKWRDLLLEWIRSSSLDKVMLLALDGVYDKVGQPVPSKTLLTASNAFVWAFIDAHPEFMFGASIHPYRSDALEELERVVKRGACAIKWIPSAMHIEPDDPACYPFYEALAHYGIPLLTHTGIEHTFGFRHWRCNHPETLVPALKAGVTVIAAHCGVPLLLHEPSYFEAWAKVANDYENMFGDLSACAIVTRARYVKRIFQDDVLVHKVLYGSDFPTMPSPYWCWPLGPSRMRALAQVLNPLERNLRVFQELGIPECVFETANKVLPKQKER